MTYIYLIAAFNAIFSATLLWQKRPKALHDNILVAWLVYLGLSIAAYAFSSHDLFTRYPLLTSVFIALFMLHGPFLHLYVNALISSGKAFERKLLWHFTPFACFILYLVASSFFPGYSEGIRMDHVARDVEPPLLFMLFLMLTALSGPVYFIKSYILFRRLDISIANNFSFSEDIDLDWLRKLVYIFGAIWTSLVAVAVVHHVLLLFTMTFCTDGLFLSLSAFVILIGYFGLKQRAIFSHEPDSSNHGYVTESKVKYAGSGLKADAAKVYVDRLERYMASEKPFLDSNLSLPQLASVLEIPSNQLSQLINESIGLNFFDFVNRYRVEEVKQKIADPQFDSFSLLGIAFECGFNSKSAFNRIFKASTGMTPSEYKRMNTAQKV